MKKLSLLAALLLLAPAALPAQASTQDAARASLEARYRLMDDGLLHGDVCRYLSVAADNLVAVDDEKTFSSRAQFKKHLSKDIDAFQHIYAFSSHIDKLEAIGDFARAQVTSTFDGTKPDKKDPARVHRYVVALKFTHEWRRIGDEWELTRFIELGETGTIDGKPPPAEHT